MSLPSPMETPVVSLRLMELRDVSTVVRLHTSYLPTGFFVELGDRFLERYYRTFLTSPAAVALIAEIDERPVGFLAGTFDETVHHQHMLQLERWRLARAGVASLLARPELTVRFLRTRARRYARGVRRSPQGQVAVEDRRTRVGMLSHIAVDESARGRGVGTALVHRFTALASLHDTQTLRLYTSHDNKPAHLFYQRLGWQSHPEQSDADGKLWTPFTVDLD